MIRHILLSKSMFGTYLSGVCLSMKGFVVTDVNGWIERETTRKDPKKKHLRPKSG